MLKRKCPDCANRVDKKYNFCPWCGTSIKSYKEREEFGLLGKNDDSQTQMEQNNQMNFGGLPLGLDKMMGPLMKQLEKELSNLDRENGAQPRNIKITFGTPQMRMQNQQVKEKKAIPAPLLSDEENNRRQSLPKEEAESKVKRLSDKIIYEISAPGVKNRKDVSITKLEQGIEIKAYTDNKCYTKNIPMEIEITNYTVKEDKIIVELKNE